MFPGAAHSSACVTVSVFVAGIVWWCPTPPRVRQKSSCGRETWCSSTRRERTAGTKAPCRGRARRACFPAASSRASERGKVDKRSHTVPVSDSYNTHTKVGPILVSQIYTFGLKMCNDLQTYLFKLALKF